MYTRVYWIEHFAQGSLGIMPRPSGNEALAPEIERLYARGVNVLVSLLTCEEAHEMGLKKEKDWCEKYEIEFINFAIEDRQVPSSSEKAKQLAETLDSYLTEDKKILIHCRGGIGRATLIAGLLLQKRGYTTTQLLEKISQIRGVPVPDTDEQVRWLRQMER